MLRSNETIALFPGDDVDGIPDAVGLASCCSCRMYVLTSRGCQSGQLSGFLPSSSSIRTGGYVKCNIEHRRATIVD